MTPLKTALGGQDHFVPAALERPADDLLTVEQAIDRRCVNPDNAQIDRALDGRDGNTVVLVPCSSQDDVTRITNEAENFCRLARRVCQAVVTIGIGKACRSLTELPDSYQGAREAVSYRSLYGAGKAINITEIAPGVDLRRDILDLLDFDVEVADELKRMEF